MKVLFEEFYEIIPKWNNNDKEEDPVVVKCRYLSPSEWSRYLSKEAVVDGERARVVVNYKERELFEASVVEIRNLEVNGKQVRNAREFLAVPVIGLYNEIVSEIIARNMTVDVKN